jgi:hypothetical protein
VYFYAVPEELTGWLETLLSDDEHWVLRWAVLPNVYTRIRRSLKLDPKEKWSIDAGPGPHFFIGSTRLCAGPVMVKRADGSEEINFLDSLCIRLVPSFIDDAVLLEGRLESFPSSKYKKLLGGKSFLAWKGDITSSLKGAIFQMPAVASQLLQDGTTKIWNNVFVSQGAIDLFAQGVKLKQFAKGPVELVPRLLNYS